MVLREMRQHLSSLHGHQNFLLITKGFSLIELLVSMTIALVVLASVFSVFSTSVKASATSLKEIRLNQELRVIMDVMVRDIRRAGYWSNADGLSANPFASPATDVSITNGNCITYSYDLDGDNEIDHNDNQGFKLVNKAVSIRKTSANCADKGGHKWEAISDSNTLDITALSFQLITNACVNLTDRGRDCDLSSIDESASAPLTGDVIEVMYVVAISLAGKLKEDESIIDSLSQAVSIRNTFRKVVP